MTETQTIKCCGTAKCKALNHVPESNLKNSYAHIMAVDRQKLFVL